MMHFGQAQLFFFPLLLPLLEIIISTSAFPFLQEIGSVDSQHSAALLTSQNLAKEKQPILLSADKAPLQKEEEFQSTKIAERIEPESAEDSDAQPVDLNEVISQIKNVETFHDQLELEKEENNGGERGEKGATKMIGRMETGGTDSFQSLSTTPNPPAEESTAEFAEKEEELEERDGPFEDASQKVQPTKMATLLLSGAETDREKEKVVVESAGGNSSDFLKENGGIGLNEGRAEGKGNKTEMGDPAKSEAEINSANKFFPIQETGGAPIAQPVDRILGETIEEEEEREGEEGGGEGLSLWDKIVLGLRCARQDCTDALIEGDGEEEEKLIKGWKITRRARRSTPMAISMVGSREKGDNGIGPQKFVCPCKNAILL